MARTSVEASLYSINPNVAMRGSDRKSTRLNSSHSQISYTVFCLKKNNTMHKCQQCRDTRRFLLCHCSVPRPFTGLVPLTTPIVEVGRSRSPCHACCGHILRTSCS